MVFAYIGTLDEGGTCLMRGEILHSFFPKESFVFINTKQQVSFLNHVFQSLAFRYKIGPLVRLVNRHVVHQIEKYEQYDCIWVDKAIYLSPKTSSILRSRTSCLIHFTPDTAFYTNRSRFFYRSLNFYDYVITTKSFDVEKYYSLIPKEKLVLCTQGYDARFHRVYSEFSEKNTDIVFIGLWEESREELLQYLLDNQLTVKLAGHGWGKFVKKNKADERLLYLGVSLKKQEYGRYISSSLFSPGLLSKKFPELHTTRSFEIPACGTALLTESNIETRSFFSDEETIFYDSHEDLLKKIQYFKAHPQELEELTFRGTQRVKADRREYREILKDIIVKTLAYYD